MSSCRSRRSTCHLGNKDGVIFARISTHVWIRGQGKRGQEIPFNENDGHFVAVAFGNRFGKVGWKSK